MSETLTDRQHQSADRAFKVSPFAARAAARAMARGTKAQTVSPRSTAVKHMRSITDTAWSPVTRERTPPTGFDKTERGMNNQERIAAQATRTRLCKHFLLGCCPHDDRCTYTHDISVMKPDEQKVFIGGIPGDCTSRQLVAAIEAVGFKVLNIPKCHPSGFSPKVCLESVEHAKQLLKIARIDVSGSTADVRKFADSRSANRDNMCVVVSGLPEGTSGRELMDGLENAGFLIERSPLVNAGETVCTRCEMATVEQADALVAIGEIQCLNSTLSFTQFAEIDKTRQTRTNRSSDRSTTSYAKQFGRTRRITSKPNGFLNRAINRACIPKRRISVEGCGIAL